MGRSNIESELADLKIKTEKKRNKLPLSNFSIAAQAKENNFVIVTKDDDFKKIDIRIEFVE